VCVCVNVYAYVCARLCVGVFVFVQVAAATLKLAEEGNFSDPPGVPMYMECGKDKDDLRLFQSVRGTNGVEGEMFPFCCECVRV
jgi:hypothetical protein